MRRHPSLPANGAAMAMGGSSDRCKRRDGQGDRGPSSRPTRYSRSCGRRPRQWDRGGRDPRWQFTTLDEERGAGQALSSRKPSADARQKRERAEWLREIEPTSVGVCCCILVGASVNTGHDRGAGDGTATTRLGTPHGTVGAIMPSGVAGVSLGGRRAG